MSSLGRKINTSLCRPVNMLSLLIRSRNNHGHSLASSSTSNTEEDEDDAATIVAPSTHYGNPIDNDDQSPQLLLSPPMADQCGIYSNFYLKLPNGKWRVRYRTRDRKIIGTYEIDGAMI